MLEFDTSIGVVKCQLAFVLLALRSLSACVSFSPAFGDVRAMPKSTLPRDSVLDALPPELSSVRFAKAHDLSVTADQIVFLAGDAGDGIYRIEDGLLKVSVSASGGGERDPCGSWKGFDRRRTLHDRRGAAVRLRLGATRFEGEICKPCRLRGIQSIQPGGLSTCDDFARTPAARHQRCLGSDEFSTPEGRVALALLNLAEGFGRDVGGGRIVLRQKVTQSDLAAMAGIARENVSRILKEWMDHSW